MSESRHEVEAYRLAFLQSLATFCFFWASLLVASARGNPEVLVTVFSMVGTVASMIVMGRLISDLSVEKLDIEVDGLRLAAAIQLLSVIGVLVWL